MINNNNKTFWQIMNNKRKNKYNKRVIQSYRQYTQIININKLISKIINSNLINNLNSN